MTELKTPVNAHEELLYGINVRLNVLIDMLSSIVEHIAKTTETTIEEVKTEVVPAKSTRAKKV